MPVIQFDLTTMTTANTTMLTDSRRYSITMVLCSVVSRRETLHLRLITGSGCPSLPRPSVRCRLPRPVATNESWGVFLAIPTSVTTGTQSALTPIGCYGFIRGDKWFCIDPGAPML